MPAKALVLDANILIRAILGKRVRSILESHAETISFLIPEEAEEQLAALVVKRGGDPAKAVNLLRAMTGLGTIVSLDLHADFEAEARKRRGARDPED